MRLMPIIYVTDMKRTIDFFETLGGRVGPTGRNPYWTEMEMGGGTFALHIIDTVSGDAEQRLGVSLVADRPLEDIRADLNDAGIEIAQDIADEAFGRSMIIRDPDGLAMQINEHHAGLHPS